MTAWTDPDAGKQAGRTVYDPTLKACDDIDKTIRNLDVAVREGRLDAGQRDVVLRYAAMRVGAALATTNGQPS